jgi:UDP-N-acetyl-D-mannosaminuronic acid dehydrogenase
MHRKTIVVIGIGYIGLSAALMWAKANQTVIGVDIEDGVVRAINEGILHLNEKEVMSLLSDPEVKKNLLARSTPCEADVFVIAVPTPVSPLKKVCDLSSVIAAVESVIPYLRKGNMIIVESTVPPLTCRNVIIPLVERLSSFKVPRDILLAHCPERILPGAIFHEIVHNERLIGGVDGPSTKAAAGIYAMFVKGKLHEVDDLSAELAKLMENTYRDVNIALANEFSQICELLGADSKLVIGLANRHPRVNILSPGIGVGGHCIPVDPWFLIEVAPYNSRLIAMARLINDETPARICAKIRRSVADIANPRIVALGASYKKNCDDMREAPANEIVRLLREDGYDVAQYDPIIPKLSYTNIVESVSGADLVAVLVCHDATSRDITENRAAIERAMRHERIVFFDA